MMLLKNYEKKNEGMLNMDEKEIDKDKKEKDEFGFIKKHPKLKLLFIPLTILLVLFFLAPEFFIFLPDIIKWLT